MRLTIKGQVTVPRDEREALGLGPGSEVAFIRQNDGSYRIAKQSDGPAETRSPFRAARGAATVRMRTDEIMALTRDA